MGLLVTAISCHVASEVPIALVPAVVSRDDIHLHLFAIEGFDPEHSYGSVIVVVPDADELYEAFAAGLRTAYGRIPSVGIPRILRPRKKHGTVYGFSVVDPGGNWLRVSTRGATEDVGAGVESSGLPRVIENAARQGDARGNDAAALQMLENGLARYTDAPAVDRARALAYLTELSVRLGDRVLAARSLSEARNLPLTDDERAAVAVELSHAAVLLDGLE